MQKMKEDARSQKPCSIGFSFNHKKHFSSVIVFWVNPLFEDVKIRALWQRKTRIFACFLLSLHIGLNSIMNQRPLEIKNPAAIVVCTLLML